MNKKYIKLHINNTSDTGYKSKYYRDMLVELGASFTLLRKYPVEELDDEVA